MFNLLDAKIKPLAGLKKTIVYSSENEKLFIEGVLNMLSITQKKAPSAILEDLVENSVLPENINARHLCKELFASKTNIMGALKGLFDIYASGINFEARYKNGYDLVRFTQEKMHFLNMPENVDNEGDWLYFIKNFKYIVEHVNQHFEVQEDDVLSITHPATYTHHILEDAVTDPKYFTPSNFTSIVLDHWDICGNYTYTFRALVALCRLLQNARQDTAEERLELIDLVKNLSKEWD